MGELVPGLRHLMHGHAVRGWPHTLDHTPGPTPCAHALGLRDPGRRAQGLGLGALALGLGHLGDGHAGVEARRGRAARHAPRTTTSVPPLPPVASGQSCRRSAPPAAAAPACDTCHYMSVRADGCDLTVFGATGDAAEPAVAGRVRDSSCSRSTPPAAAAAWQQNKGRQA